MTFRVGCTGKKRFHRFTLAASSAKRMRSNDEEAHVEAYHCKFCNGFHLGEARSHGRLDARRTEEKRKR